MLHYLSHAQHAMSDIMLNLGRPPPRQLRARPFVIQSVMQSAVIQTVPVQQGGPAPAGETDSPTGEAGQQTHAQAAQQAHQAAMQVLPYAHFKAKCSTVTYSCLLYTPMPES